MKKILALLLAAMLCVSLGACSNSKYQKYDTLIQYLEDENYDQAYLELVRLANGENDAAENEEVKVRSVEITTDNWDDYFEFVQEESPDTNDFGEIERVFLDNYLKLKDGFELAPSREGSQTEVAVEYSYTQEYRFYELNTATGEFTLGELNEEKEPQPKTDMKTIREAKTGLNNGHTWSDDGGWIAVDTNIAMIRAQGTLYIIEK